MSDSRFFAGDVPLIAFVDHVRGDYRPLSLTVALEVAVMAEQLEDEADAGEWEGGAC